MEATFYQMSAIALNGEEITFDRYKGKYVLVVNTASKCGHTKQYAGLQSLCEKYKDRGLVILGFPCNQFGGQEPGDEQSIADGVVVKYGVTFPMFSKVKVNSKEAHPLFQYLKKELPGEKGERITWNFTKFLIDRDGKPMERFIPKVKPEEIDPILDKLMP
ncbi:MAG: glutathione peroxidase [Bacteroidales bacterium]|jgi:glutathione peroxidase